MVYYRRGPVITRVESRTDFNYPNNTLCSKGYAQLQEQYHPERLRRRRAGRRVRRIGSRWSSPFRNWGSRRKSPAAGGCSHLFRVTGVEADGLGAVPCFNRIKPLPTYREPAESPVSKPDMAAKYPLVLMTGARIPFYTHSKWREIPWVSEFQPEPVINLNPNDAGRRGIKEGDRVVLENSYGQLRVKAHLTEMVGPGVVDMFHGWPDQDVNTMVARDFDPIFSRPDSRGRHGLAARPGFPRFPFWPNTHLVQGSSPA
jgi:anaerobic selenocysteine-containing dehydrogenase